MSYNPNNPNGQASPANSAPVVLDTTDSGYLQSMNAAIASILANQTNGTQEVLVTNFPSIQAVSQSGTWSVGRTWDLTSGTDSVTAAQGGTWNITNISGTISLPTGAATSALQTAGNTSLGSILAALTNGTQETQVTNFPSVQAVSQSGSWTVSLTSESIEIGKVDQGNAGSNAQAWWTQIGDTAHGPVAVKAASTAAAAADPSLVVALSPNSPLPAGSNVLGAVTQSGTWTTARSWNLTSGADSVTAAQGGTWNITNISGAISLPTGASTSALQTTGNSTLSSILANQTNGTQETQVTNFPSVQAVSQSGTWNIANITGTVSLPTGAATSALQTTGNSTLSSILAALTNGTQETQVTNFPAIQAVSQSGTWTVQQGTPPWAFNLNQVGGSAFALGQAAAAASLPVVTQSDSSPSSQSITAQDTASTTTAGANGQSLITGSPTAGSFASFALASFATVQVLVTGTWTGTLVSEVSMDGGTTWLTHGVKQTGAAYTASSFTANFEAAGAASGYTNYRIRATTAWTGTATVKVNLSINPYVHLITNPLTLRDSTVQSIANTIKAASTAAAAADTALVVGLSPNSPLPAGTNILGSLNTNQDKTATGTIAALNASVSVASNGCSSAIVSITGTWSATLTFQAQTADGNWNTIGVAPNTGGQNVSTTAANGVFVFGCGGFQAIRVTATAYTSGTVNVALETSVGDSQTLATDANGNQQVVGSVAAATADSGNPVKIGGVAATSQPSAVTNGQRTNLLTDKLGRMVSSMSHVRDLQVNQTTTIASSTAETTFFTAVASTFLDLTSLVITNATATQVTVTIRDATAGTVRAVFDLAPFGGMVFNPHTPWKQTAVGNNWTATLSVATVTVHIFAIAVENI